MKILFPNMQGRPFYDRNAVFVGKNGLYIALAPHGGIVRHTYTTPLDKRGIIEAVFVTFMRRVAATGPGEVASTLNIFAAGVSNPILRVNFTNNTVYGSAGQYLGLSLWIPPESEITFLTQDGGTGGQVDYGFGYHLVLFDL